MQDLLIGQKFNHWTILETGHRHANKAALKCKCDCGTEKICNRYHVTAGSSKSCGCIMGQAQIKVPESIIGQVFGRLTIIAEGRIAAGWKGKENTTKQSVTYRCECGEVREVIRRDVISGNTKSCGCLNLEKVIERSTTHGLASRTGRSSTYTTWANVVARATKPPKNNKNVGYFERGIAERWLTFENFLSDMGEKPEGERISIERTNNDIGYFPGNCIWSTDHVQSRNKSNNKYYTIDRETLCLTDWATKCDLDKNVVRLSIERGRTIEQALNLVPWVRHEIRRTLIEVDGITKTRKEWCELFNQDEQMVRGRMRRGEDIKRALRIV